MVECDLAKVDVAGSSPVSRSKNFRPSLPEPDRFAKYAMQGFAVKRIGAAAKSRLNRRKRVFPWGAVAKW